MVLNLFAEGNVKIQRTHSDLLIPGVKDVQHWVHTVQVQV